MERPASFVILHNVSKKHNVGTISRCATAFNVQQVRLQRGGELGLGFGTPRCKPGPPTAGGAGGLQHPGIQAGLMTGSAVLQLAAGSPGTLCPNGSILGLGLSAVEVVAPRLLL